MGRREVKNTGPNITFLDIETAPLVVYTWGIWEQNVGINQIIKPWSLMSVAWMVEGGSMRYQDNRHADDPRDDRELLITLWDVLDAADVVVTQNGIHFDIRRINARFIELGMSPPSSFRQVDTKVEAKKVAAFVSNKLEWLAKAIAGSEKQKHKNFPGFELWSEALNGNVKAWKEMEKYNRQDVVALRAVYLKLRPWMKNHPNHGQYREDEDGLQTCPKCGTVDRMQARGYSYTAAGKYQRYVCTACGGWSRAGKNLLTKPKRATLLKGD